MNEPVIVLEGVYFRYGELLALEDISLSIREKEFLGIIGPNGSGKSTLLKLILGLLTPEKGKISVFGAPPAEACLKIGYVPQFATFNRDFPISVLDTVLQSRLGLTRTVFGYRRQDREIACEALAEMAIGHLHNRSLSALSGGQLQRVLIARALACQPQILILDEPTAHIDPRVEKGIFELLKRLNERLTMIVVSHDIGFIVDYITRVACVNRKLVCHTTSKISGKMIEELYGGPMRAIHHDTRLDGHK